MPALSPFIVTLDGPAGVGKTTLAKRIAQALDIVYLDTGAMFRATALKLQTSDPAKEYGALLEKLCFSLEGTGAQSTLLLNGQPVGPEIRTEEVAMMASHIATIPQVRSFQKTVQQGLGRQASLIAEGRDMGTVVFPAAQVKIFLEATAAIRARRRYNQLVDQGQSVRLDAILQQMQVRDAQDTNRTTAPLCPAQDAVIIDTSLLRPDEVFSSIMQVVQEKR